MMKAEKGSEIITTICEYENSVAMPDNERLTYLDTCGIARLKDGNGNVKHKKPMRTDAASTCGSDTKLTLPPAAHTVPTMP